MTDRRYTGAAGFVPPLLLALAAVAGAWLLSTENAAGGEIAMLDKPAYKLYSLCSKPIRLTDEDARQLAANFVLLHGKLGKEQNDLLRSLNPEFTCLTYINSTYTRSAEEVGPTERLYRHGLSMHLSATLDQAIGPEDTHFKVLPVKESEVKGADGKPGIAIRASTIEGDYSSADPAVPSTQSYVFWIRIGDEFLRVNQFDRETGAIEVSRAFADTKAAAHEAGARVFSPVYLGFLRVQVTEEDEMQGAGKHPGNYPGGPGERIRYVMDPQKDDGNKCKAELALQCMEGDGVDGVWMDTFNTGDFNISDCLGRPVIIWNFEKGEPYQPDDFRLGQERKVTYIQNYIKEKLGHYPFLVANNLKTATYYPGQGGMRLMLVPTEIKPRPLDGFCMEGALSLQSFEDWRGRMQILMDASQAGLPAMPILGGAGAKSILGEADTPERDKRERFGYASYLLTVEKGGRTLMGTYAFYQTDGERHVKVHPIYYYPIGDPAETVKPEDIDRYQVPGTQAYKRQFTNGAVLVNASPDAEATVDLGEDYVDPDTRQTVREIVLPPATGKVLLKN
ncbi:MAG: hypothetical protein NTW86_07195 [Candidatus Sumerlaeota bacterium]|nr:hypothetical protein [Candidatus Sumerlaeota bacterium]